MMKGDKELHWLMKKNKNEEFFSPFPIFCKYHRVLWLTIKCCTSDQLEALSNYQQTRLEVKKKWGGGSHYILLDLNVISGLLNFLPPLSFYAPAQDGLSLKTEIPSCWLLLSFHSLCIVSIIVIK